MMPIGPVTYTVRPGESLYHIAQKNNTTVPKILAQNPRLHPGHLKPGTTLQILPAMASARSAATYPSANQRMALSNDMRLAWEQHVYWTRMALISIAGRLPDQTATVARLLQNPADIANIFRRYYPDAAADVIEKLLTEHLQIGAQLMTAVRDGDSAAVQTLSAQWRVNADQMATAFHNINPNYYGLEATRSMLYEHLDLTTKEVVDRVAGNYAADVADFDRVEADAMMMADFFTEGLVRQFPDKF